VTTALLFAGQGVPPPWVARELLDTGPARALLAAASEATGADVARLVARGGRALERPEILQPALVAVCLAVDALLEEAGVRPDLVLGHSLGELSAWAASGAIDRAAAVAAAALRGRLMAREAAARPGGMLALRGADQAACEEALAAGAAAGAISLAAENAPDEWVLAGDDAALAAAAAAARVPSVRLPVAGPWHSPAMAGAEAELAAALAALPRRPSRALLVSGRDGRAIAAGDAEVPALLAGQLTRPNRFAPALRQLAACGASRLVAVGPGKLLRSLVRRTLGPSIEVDVADGPAAIARLRGAAPMRRLA